MRWSCVVGPLVGARTVPASLRRDHQILRIGKECFRDELFIHMGAIGICRVNEIHAQFCRSSQNCYCLRATFRRPPDAFSCETHCSEPKPMDGSCPAERNTSCLAC